MREARGWAYVDPPAGDITGRIALRHPAAWPLIDARAAGEDFWVRRSALLALLPGIRQGQPDPARFERHATWTRRHLDLMSGVTFAEAVRRLPEKEAASLRAARARAARTTH